MATLTCPLCCHREFAAFSELKQHLLGILENLKCTNCNNSFTNPMDFIQHLNDNDCQFHNDIGLINLKAEIEDQQSSNQLKNDDDNGNDNSNRNYDNLQLVDNSILNDQNENSEINENLNEIENLGDYYCQMCGIHFNEIEEHLKDFHEGQEIIVEDDHNEPSMEIDETNHTKTIYLFDNSQLIFDSVENDINNDDQVKETMKKQNDDDDNNNDNDDDGSDEEMNIENVKDKDGRSYIRKFVKIDKFWLQNKQPIIQQYIIDNGEVKKLTNDEIDKIVDKSTIIDINQCPDCNLLFTNVDNYKKHKCDRYNVEKYECSVCNLIFNGLDDFREHLKQHITKNNGGDKKKTLFNCDVCNTTLPTFKSLRLHRRMHEPVKERKIEAPVQYDIKDVIIKDVDQTRPMFLCKICNKSYDKQYEDIHIESHNSNDGYNCETCNRKFFSQSNLEMHLKAHSNNKKFSCSYCKKPFVTYESLNGHLCKERMYACQYCGRRFVRPHEKVKHERIHTGEKPHVCEICGKAFRVNYCLTLHLRTHSGARPYQCFTCGKRFKSHSVYNHHLLTHSEVRNYKCPYCPKAFKTSVQLAGHKNSHIKPFTCTECNRPFASLYAVRAHMETHKRENNLRYECWICGALYSRAFALRDHMKQQHQDSSNSSSNNSVQTKVLNVEEEIDAANSILVKEDDIVLSLDSTTNIEIIENDCR